MFLKSLFAKDWRHHLEKGKKYLGEEHFADARHAFEEALQRIGREGGDTAAAVAEINAYLDETGNRLGLLNIAEAEHAVKRGDAAKAEEHLELARDLAVDPEIRGQAERLMASLASTAAPVHPSQTQHHQHSCSGCGTIAVAAEDHEHFSADHLSAQERFELLVHPLPGDLPHRYAALGEKFVQGYLLVQDGKEYEGGLIFQELLAEEENDILLYELAMINCRNGNAAGGEQLLRRALTVNDANPLIYLSLVQLMADTGRLTDCIPLLNHMIDHGLLIEQAMMYLGDIYQGLGNEEKALETYSIALNYPSAAKGAAERLVTILQRQNRHEEAAFLFKRYLKGCC